MVLQHPERTSSGRDRLALRRTSSGRAKQVLRRISNGQGKLGPLDVL